MDPDTKVLRKREDISSTEPSRCLIVIYRLVALSTLYNLNSIRDLIYNSLTSTF